MGFLRLIFKVLYNLRILLIGHFIFIDLEGRQVDFLLGVDFSVDKFSGRDGYHFAIILLMLPCQSTRRADTQYPDHHSCQKSKENFAAHLPFLHEYVSLSSVPDYQIQHCIMVFEASVCKSPTPTADRLDPKSIIRAVIATLIPSLLLARGQDAPFHTFYKVCWISNFNARISIAYTY